MCDRDVNSKAKQLVISQHHIHLSTHNTNTENYIVHEIPTMFRAWIIVHDSVYPFVCVYIVYVFLACVRYLTITELVR
jgi:hypothetical protein